MQYNEIVNKNWLPLPVLASAKRSELQSLILQGKLASPADLPASVATLGEDACSYLLEKSAQVAGQPARLLSLLAGLPSKPPAGSSARALWEERSFLRAFALSRLGREEEAAPLFGALPARFQPLAQIERALSRLNSGDLAGAEAMFRGVLGQGGEGIDPYSLCTLLGGLSLALIHQGDFRAAELCLKGRRKVLDAHPAPVLAFGTRLYEILLLLERNDFGRAATLLDRSLREMSASSVNGFFLLHLQLQLRLARNDLEQAEKTLRELQQLWKELKLSDGVFGYRLEEIEWKIRAGRNALAQAIISEVEERALARKDEFLLFRLLLLKAQALAQEGKAAPALAEAKRAIHLGEAKRYRPGLSWAFFHAAGIALAAGQSLEARLFLHRGRRLAEELRLPVRVAALSYMSEVLENRYASASALVSLAKHREIGPELEYFLGAYRLLESVTLLVKDGRGQNVVEEPELRRRLFQEPGLFWFQKEAVLLSNVAQGQKGRSVATVEFPHQSPVLAAFRMFWSAFQGGERGLRLRDVHKARLACTYREELHGGAAKMLVSRLRQQLAGSGLELLYDRESQRYRLQAEIPAFTIQSSAGKAAGGQGKKSREEALLGRIAMEPFVATQELCQEFGVSRQALHPLLKKLTEAGKIRLVRRGPISGYISRMRG